jgi:hypothetical protein
MKTEVMKYQALAGSIKSFEERKDIKGKDTFDLFDWWKSNCATLSGFVYVLRAVLTNSPNSIHNRTPFSLRFSSLCTIFRSVREITWFCNNLKNRMIVFLLLVLQSSMQSQFNKRGLR